MSQGLSLREAHGSLLMCPSGTVSQACEVDWPLSAGHIHTSDCGVGPSLLTTRWDSVLTGVFSHFEVWLEISPELGKQIRQHPRPPPTCSQLAL